MKGVTYEHAAAAQADAAKGFWPRAEDVIMMLEWTLARDPSAGLPYEGNLRFIVFPGAKSVGLPSVDCLFEPTPQRIIIHELEFY